MATVRCGPEVLADYLWRNDSRAVRLAWVSLGEFREWLAARIAEQQHNPVFAQQCRIRELVRAHRDELHRRKQAQRQAAEAYRASPQRDRLEQLATKLVGLEKAVAGLTKAVDENRADPQKLANFRAERERVRTDFQALSQSLPERIALDQAEAALDRFREQIGLAAEEEQLAVLRRQRGGRLVKSGRHFETVAADAARELIVPALPHVVGPVKYLTGVTLDSARAELDGVLVLLTPDSDVVEVLALVEAKRNVNDIARGFRIRQENLAWFTGERGGYDPAQYRTRTYPAGHFDRPATHAEDGRLYRFDATSFRRFKRDAQTGLFLRGLCFVVKDRPLVGVSTPQLGRIMHRVATDPDFDIESDAIISRYQARVRSMAGGRQARDVLELYAREEPLARQIIFVTDS